MEKKCAVPTFYLYGSGDDGTYDAYSRPDDDGEWCHIDDVTAELARLRAELAAARDALTTPPLARMQPCGCVVCVCDDHERCHGCGAVACNDPSCVFTSAETRQRIIYDGSPSYAQLRAENERLRQLGTEIRNRLKNHARTLDLDDWALASIRACDAWDSALAALDQERKGK